MTDKCAHCKGEITGEGIAIPSGTHEESGETVFDLELVCSTECLLAVVEA